MMRKNNSKGFTMVEMAIVMVIVGLIVGGVLGGQELIKSARVNSIVTDFSKYERATNTFKLKYDALPGDMGNATDYWATATNGTNDGKIAMAETFYAWEMLGLSGITSPYTGTSFGSAVVAGVNFPQSRYCESCGFNFVSEAITVFLWDTATEYLNQPVGNVNKMVMGGTDPNGVSSNGALPGLVAKQVDQKMDDGLAGTGRMLGGDSFAVATGRQMGCITAGIVAAYDVTDESSLKCILVYTLDVDDQ